MKALALRLALFCSLVALLGAADSNVYPPPIAVVYPLTVTGQSGAEAGANVSTLLATKLAQLGGITVRPYPPGTQRSAFLDAAKSAGADYYITGYMTPVGAELSMIVQVVSVESGSIVYSTTTMVRTYGDALAQADQLRSAMLRHAGRSLAALDAPPPAPSSTPAATAGGGVNLSRALKRRQRPAPAGSPSSSPAPLAATSPASVAVAAVPAAPRALVAEFAGSADPRARAYAAKAFSSALARGGTAGGVVPVSAADALAHAPDLCRANAGASLVYAGSLALGPDPNAPQSVSVDVAAYDCSGTAVARQHASSGARGRGGIDAAIDRVVAEAAAGFRKSRATPTALPAKS